MSFVYENNIRAVVVAADLQRVPEGRAYLEVEALPPLEEGGRFRINWEAGTVEAVPGEEAVPVPPDASRLREDAYNAERLIQWPAGSGELLTVTEASAKWCYYLAEGDIVTADALTVLIAAAKEEIREKYPDET